MRGFGVGKMFKRGEQTASDRMEKQQQLTRKHDDVDIKMEKKHGGLEMEKQKDGCQEEVKQMKLKVKMIKTKEENKSCRIECSGSPLSITSTFLCASESDGSRFSINTDFSLKAILFNHKKPQR